MILKDLSFLLINLDKCYIQKASFLVLFFTCRCTILCASDCEFTGILNAFESFADFNKGKRVTSVGTGFRYLLARKLGTNMGMDFACTQDDLAVYVIFGTAWMR
jgi:hypothetical protein